MNDGADQGDSQDDTGGLTAIDLRNESSYNEPINSSSEPAESRFYVSEEKPGVKWAPAGGEKVVESDDYASAERLIEGLDVPLAQSGEAFQRALKGVEAVLLAATDQGGSNAPQRIKLDDAVGRVVTVDFLRSLGRHSDTKG